MQKKIFKSIVWVIVFIALLGLCRFCQYKIDMYYSGLAADQMENDNAYGELTFQSMFNGIVSFVFLVLLFVSLYRIVKVWLPAKQAPVEKDT